MKHTLIAGAVDRNNITVAYARYEIPIIQAVKCSRFGAVEQILGMGTSGKPQQEYDQTKINTLRHETSVDVTGFRDEYFYPGAMPVALHALVF
ncbi:MAG: hypothetical protein JSU65_12600 [Candidatus Zixiibacteriota bacterium]|nr:MAG: hypothetical protein JSU65_12600 [candidate division Zixibacteria bacterium]